MYFQTVFIGDLAYKWKRYIFYLKKENINTIQRIETKYTELQFPIVSFS